MARPDLSRDVPRTGIPERLARDMTMADRVEWHATERRRHPVSRRAVLQGLGLGVGASVVGPTLWRQTTARAADATIGSLHTTFGSVPTQQMRVTGQITASPGSDRLFVDYGPTDAFGSTAAARLEVVDNALTAAPTQYYLHGRLRDLSPATSYRYRLRTSSGIVSSVGTVRTAPAPRTRTPFRFTAFGDENTTAGADAVLALQRQQQADFHLLAGDICYADGSGAGLPTDHFDPRQWDRYLAKIAASASSTPWLFGTGNHDMEAVYGEHGYGALVKRVASPGGGAPGAPTTFAFRYGNVGFLSIDLNDVSSEIPANVGYTGGAQATWVDATLRGFRNAAGLDFVVVLCHHALYGTSSSHGSDAGARAAYAAVFDDHAVDLVVNGHAHNYERTDPIRAGRATVAAVPGSAVRASERGTTYVTAGGGGASPVGFTGGPSDGRAVDNPPVSCPVSVSPGVKTRETVTWSRCRQEGYGLLVADVVPSQGRRPGRMTVRYVSVDGSTRDTIVFST